MANMTVFKQHFDLLEETMDWLRNQPAIFNCNNSMIAIDRRTGKVVILTKTKQA